jgi:hypothetical protein
MAIRGYHGDTEDTCRAKKIKRDWVMKIQNRHDRDHEINGGSLSVNTSHR